MIERPRSERERSLSVAFLDTPQEARFLEIDQIIADHQRHLQKGGPKTCEHLYTTT